MFGPSGGALAASVTNAGGFGFIGVGYSFNKSLPKELEIAKEKLAFSGMNAIRRKNIYLV